MAEMTRPLPERDLLALFDVLVTLHGELLLDQVPANVAAHLARRLANDGLIEGEPSVGELAATIGDLTQRVRYALGQYSELPEASPRGTTYILRLPSPAAARACQEELVSRGALTVTVHDAETGDGWELLASFPELAPDPSYHERVVQIRELASVHDGRYEASVHGSRPEWDGGPERDSAPERDSSLERDSQAAPDR